MMASIRRHLVKYKPYRVARAIYWRLPRIIKELDSGNGQVISLIPEGSPHGDVLLSYMTGDFLLNPDAPIPNSHTSYWKSLEMTKTFLELGYRVDAISFGNHDFLPRKNYSAMIDTRYNFERLASFLDKQCIKIMHMDTAHILFHNAAEANRLLALQRRKGVTLRQVRYERPNLAIEHADCGVTCANEFTIGTFRYAGKPIYQLPCAAGRPCPWPVEKDFEACRKHFFWYASHGMVFKGLDLVLEAFAEMPDCHLTICGPVEKEPEFVRVYRKELYQTPNIHLRGWIDIDSQDFVDLANQCIANVYVSCSEGGGASVIETMHAGLIPIVSYETSVDVHDFGVMLKSASIEDIREGVRMIAETPATELERRARRAWEHARAEHTRERFSEEYRKTIRTILASAR